MGESGFHPPPLLRNAEIASENDHVIARLEVLVPFRVELVEVGQECEEITDNLVDTAIDAPVGESFGNIPLDVIRQERFERIHVCHGVVQLPDESDLRLIRHANPPKVGLVRQNRGKLVNWFRGPLHRASKRRNRACLGRAYATEGCPSPPIPRIATRSPALAGALRRALKVVTPAQRSGAASTESSSSGTEIRPLALAIITSA